MNKPRIVAPFTGQGKTHVDGSAAEADALWRRLEAFELDSPADGFMFSERLAKENAWSLGYARRVINEYKKFLFLAVRSEHVVCPSEDVDQVWHMHLTYTRNYWDELCGKVLGTAVHHGPSKGGDQEREKYYRLYQRTLESYRQWFASDPPADIWSAPDQRFGEDLQCVRINASRHWILPKPRLAFFRSTAVGLGSAALLLPVAQLAPNPLDWRGGDFLVFFTALLLLATIGSWVARAYLLRSDENFSSDEAKSLLPIEAAWMEGGDARAISCALVELAQADAIEIRDGKVQSGSASSNFLGSNRLTQLIHSGLLQSGGSRTWAKISRDARVGLIAMRQALEERGLATTYMQRSYAFTVILFLMGGVLLLGGAKIVVGLGRGRPIGYLVLLELAGLAIAFMLFKSVPRVTAKGRRLLDQLKSSMKNQQSNADAGAGAFASDNGLVWSTALLGTGVLASTAYADVDLYTRKEIAANHAAGSGGCGGTGCGGDGGGGGGCGGGCGGCGG